MSRPERGFKPKDQKRPKKGGRIWAMIQTVMVNLIINFGLFILALFCVFLLFVAEGPEGPKEQEDKR